MTAYHAKKRLGQNFLKTESVIERIVALCEATPDDRVIEIGSGRGALTYPLAQIGCKIKAIEFDRDLIPYLTKLLRDFPNAEIHPGDILEFVPDQEWDRFILLGNLPYNITSPVIDWCCLYRKHVQRAVFMIQKEVAERVAGQPGSKAWSPLAINTQLHFEVVEQFDVAPKHFRPQPEVTSSVITLERRQIDREIPDGFDEIVAMSFAQRRKQLARNLADGLNCTPERVRDLFSELGLEEDIRAEQVTLEQFLDLTAQLVRHKLYNR